MPIGRGYSLSCNEKMFMKTFSTLLIFLFKNVLFFYHNKILMNVFCLAGNQRQQHHHGGSARSDIIIHIHISKVHVITFACEKKKGRSLVCMCEEQLKVSFGCEYSSFDERFRSDICFFIVFVKKKLSYLLTF